MRTPDSIIVYRNPAEAAIWESGLVFPIIGSAGVALLLMVIVAKLYTFCFYTLKWKWLGSDASIPVMISGIVAFLTTLKFMGGL